MKRRRDASPPPLWIIQPDSALDSRPLQKHRQQSIVGTNNSKGPDFGSNQAAVTSNARINDGHVDR
jgi:hypothetical protein